MEHIAHRGCARQFPENTRRAVRSCAAHVDRVELDVRRCGSGELVVHHRDDLAAKTDAEGRVHGTSLDALQEVDVLGTGSGIPSLASLLDDVPPDVALQLDLKHGGLAADVADVVAGREHDVYACSADVDALRRVRETGLPFGYVSFTYFEARPVSDAEVARLDYGDALETAAALGCEFVEAPHELCVQTDFVADAHDAGLDVVAWPIATAETADAVRDAGVDGLMLDRYDVT
jgi:glycerophosphoryl diester phosphodiesterase